MALDNQWLKKEIETMGFPCAVSLFAGTEKTCIVVAMGEGPDHEMQSMQLWVEPQNLESAKEPLALLHLFVPVCRYQQPFIGDIAGIVLNANVGLNIPGFGLSIEDKYVYYRSSTFLNEKSALDILKSMMGLAMTYVDGFSSTMKAVASGKKNGKQAVLDLLQSAKGV